MRKIAEEAKEAVKDLFINYIKKYSVEVVVTEEEKI
jgi:hypothetical protein